VIHSIFFLQFLLTLHRVFSNPRLTLLFTSSSLQQKGYVVARLTNQVPYNQATTEIQYRRGQENQARRLNTLLAVQANVVESSHLSPAVGVRILLGRDIAQRSMVTDSETRQPALAKEETTAPTRG